MILQILVTVFFTSYENIAAEEFDKLGERHPGLVKARELYEKKPSALAFPREFLTVLFSTGAGVFSGMFFYTLYGSMRDLKTMCIMVLSVYGALLIFVLIGLYIPYYLAFHKPARGIFPSYLGFRFLECIFLPSIFLCDHVAMGICMIFGVNAKEDQNDVTEAEIISMVNEGHEQGVLLASEAEMIQNIIAFDEKDAKDIMIHRKDIVALDGEDTLSMALSLFNQNNYSRIPVYLEDLDNIIGIIHMKELFFYSNKVDLYQTKIRDLDGLMGPVEFVPETHGINTLFTQMQFSKSHMVIVTDEYGQTSGLISMEDILEEIVGNIEDEHDVEDQSIEKRSDDTFLMEGRTELSEVGETLGVSFEGLDVETLNGFLISQIDRIPKEGEQFDVEAFGYNFHVYGVSGNMIQKVLVSPRESAVLYENRQK